MGVERPSIALGLLKAALERQAISCSTVYGNLLFAEQLGLDRYQKIMQTSEEALLAEWTFAAAAFGDAADANYPRRLLARNGATADPLYDDLAVASALASEFVDRLAAEILAGRPRIVGCSSMFQQNTASLALLRRIRENDPTVITMMGGANCEDVMGQSLVDAFPWVDYAVSGEADLLIADLCRLALRHGRDIPPEQLPYGTLRRDPLGMSEAPVPRATVRTMDRCPTPDYDDYFAALNRSSLAPWIRPGLFAETARGCWWGEKHHCTFCGLNGRGMTFRAKSPDRVEAEFAELSQRHGVRHIEVVDNILDMEYLKTVMAALADAERGYKILYETKANLKREHVELLAAAGVTWIQPGIESLHDDVLRLMDKGTTALINVHVLKWARTYGLRTLWSILHGFPGEKDSWYGEMASWMPLVSHFQPPMAMVPILYHRFSPYFARQEEFGLELRPRGAYRDVYPPTVRLDDLAYTFEDDRTEATRLFSPLLRRVGLAAVTQCVRDWRELWRGLYDGSELPALRRLDEDDGRLRVVDTRPCAVERDTVLGYVATRVYLACDRPTSPASVAGALAGEISAGEVMRALDDLIERGLVLSLGGHLLALATPDPSPPLPDLRDFPGGWVDVAGYRATASVATARPA